MPRSKTKGDYLQPGDLNRYLKGRRRDQDYDQFPARSEIEGKLKGLVTQFESSPRRRRNRSFNTSDRSPAIDSILEGVSLAIRRRPSGLSRPTRRPVIIAGGLFGRRNQNKTLPAWNR